MMYVTSFPTPFIGHLQHWPFSTNPRWWWWLLWWLMETNHDPRTLLNALSHLIPTTTSIQKKKYRVIHKDFLLCLPLELLSACDQFWISECVSERKREFDSVRKTNIVSQTQAIRVGLMAVKHHFQKVCLFSGVVLCVGRQQGRERGIQKAWLTGLAFNNPRRK